jgi:hypothetical protein
MNSSIVKILFTTTLNFYSVLDLYIRNIVDSIYRSLFHVDLECSFFYEDENLRDSDICIRHFYIDDLPLFFNSSIRKIEIIYEHENNKYRYVEKNPYNAVKICKFSIPTTLPKIVGPKGIISCVLNSTGPLTVFEKTPGIDITSLLLQYQGPLKDFHQNTDFRVKDIMHDYINENCYIEILDTNVDSYVFKYDDIINLTS